MKSKVERGVLTVVEEKVTKNGKPFVMFHFDVPGHDYPLVATAPSDAGTVLSRWLSVLHPGGEGLVDITALVGAECSLVTEFRVYRSEGRWGVRDIVTAVPAAPPLPRDDLIEDLIALREELGNG